MKITDAEQLETSRKYGVIPGSLKCQVYCLLDKGYSRREIRYILGNGKKDKSLSDTVRKYSKLWEEAQMETTEA